MTHKNLQKIFFAISLFTGLCGGSEIGNAAAFQFGGLRLDSVTVTSTASTTTLTKADRQLRIISGSTTDVEKLPDATTLQAGYFFGFMNNGTSSVTVLNGASAIVGILAPREWANAWVTSASTTGGPWAFEKTNVDNAVCTVVSPITPVIDWNLGPCYTLALDRNSTLAFINRQAAHKTILIRITNTAANFTVAWPSAAKFPAATSPTETVGAKQDAITCDHDGSTTICNSVQNF